MKPSEHNPDYIRYSNDKKQKKLTIKHLEQKIAYEKKSLESDRKWAERSKERYIEHFNKVNEMIEQLNFMYKNNT